MEIASLGIEEHIVTNHITQFLGVGNVGILTTILVIKTSKYITTSHIILSGQIILSILVPLEYRTTKGCILTDCFQTNGGISLSITNTSVSDLNRNNFALIFTKGSNNSSRLSTKTITIDINCGGSSILYTRVNNSNRDDTTINHNWLCKSTRTRVQFDRRLGGITNTRVSKSNTRDRSTDTSNRCSTSSTTTSNRNARLGCISSTRILNENLSDFSVSHNCLCSSTLTATTNDRDQWLGCISATLVDNLNVRQRSINSYLCSSTYSTTI